MKFFYIPLILTTLATLDTTHGKNHFHLRRLNSDEDDGYGLIMSDDSHESACVQVRNDHVRKNQCLILGDCNGLKAGWRLDDNGLFHTELDDEWCIQAGKRGQVEDGEFARMRKCNPSKELQQFEWRNGGGIRPLSNDEFCLVWRGNHADVGIDPLIFKYCDDVEDRNDWSGNA